MKFDVTDIILELQTIEWSNLVAWLAIIIAAFPKVKKMVKDFELESGIQFPWTVRRRELDKKLIDLDDRINDLNNRFEKALTEEHNNHEIWHHQSEEIRDQINNDIRDLIEKFDSYIRTDNKRTIATLRTSLWRMHRDFMDQGYVTPDGLKTFKEMGLVYEEAGGNDIYHEKLLPEVLSLEIRYPDGGVYDN